MFDRIFFEKRTLASVIHRCSPSWYKKNHRPAVIKGGNMLPGYEVWIQMCLLVQMCSQCNKSFAGRALIELHITEHWVRFHTPSAQRLVFLSMALGLLAFLLLLLYLWMSWLEQGQVGTSTSQIRVELKNYFISTQETVKYLCKSIKLHQSHSKRVRIAFNGCLWMKGWRSWSWISYFMQTRSCRREIGCGLVQNRNCWNGGV